MAAARGAASGDEGDATNKAERLALSVRAVADAVKRHNSGTCTPINCYHWHGREAYEDFDEDLDYCSFCQKLLYDAPPDKLRSGSTPMLMITRSCPHAVHSSCYWTRREQAEEKHPYSAVAVVDALRCLKCKANGMISEFPLSRVVNFNVRDVGLRRALVDVQQARKCLQDARGGAPPASMVCRYRLRGACYAALAFQPAFHPASVDCVFVHDGEATSTVSAGTSSMLSVDSIASALTTTTLGSQDKPRFMSGMDTRWWRASDAADGDAAGDGDAAAAGDTAAEGVGPPRGRRAPGGASASSPVRGAIRRATPADPTVACASTDGPDEAPADASVAPQTADAEPQASTLSMRMAAVEALLMRQAERFEQKLREITAAGQADAAEAQANASEALRKVATLERHVGFVWTATMTNGYFGHITRVMNQTRVLFASRVAAAVGRDFAPVRGDPGTKGSWEKGKVLVPLRPVGGSGTEAATPAPELIRLFGNVVRKNEGAADTEENTGGVFGFTLVLGDATSSKASLEDHGRARAAHKGNPRLSDPDASRASQPLLRGVELEESVTEEFARGFGLVKQAGFLTSVGQQRNRFAHGDDGKGVGWKSGTAEAFARDVQAKIQELLGVAGRLKGAQFETTAPVSASTAGASASDRAPVAPSVRTPPRCVFKTTEGSWEERMDDDPFSIDNITTLLKWAEYAVSHMYGNPADAAVAGSTDASGAASASAGPGPQ